MFVCNISWESYARHQEKKERRETAMTAFGTAWG
jgi:hypothetical protein